MSKVSICIPAYKQVDSLVRLLDSIFIQSYEDYEIIISDDTSDDSIKECVERYLFKFNNKIKYKKNPIALGSPENWNEAIRNCNSEYIKIMHHDDWFTQKDSLSIFVKMLDDNPNSNIAFSSSSAINSMNELIYLNAPSKEAINEIEKSPFTLLDGNIIGAPSACIFRKTNPLLLFDNKLKWLVDIEFYVRIIEKSKSKIIYNNYNLVSIGISLNQITEECKNDKSIWINEIIYLYDKWKIKFINKGPIKNNLIYIINNFKINSFSEFKIIAQNKKLPNNLKMIFLKIQCDILIKRFKNSLRTFYSRSKY